MKNKILFVFAFIFILSGCSNLKIYPDKLTANFFVKTRVDSDVKARVDIYEMDKKCEGEYVGTVDLNKGNTKFGLEKARLSYLDFRFISSSFFSSSSSSSGMSTLIKPRKGYRYDISVSYEDNIYDVEIRENQKKKKKGRELNVIPLHACKKFK